MNTESLISKNEFNQFVYQTIDKWEMAKKPLNIRMEGSYAIVEPLSPVAHADKLFKLFSVDPSNWTYLPYGPFDTYHDFYEWLTAMTAAEDPMLYAILDKNNTTLGMAGYLRIIPEHASIEVGHLHFSNTLKKTPIATEAMYLMMEYVFEQLGYRRYEWKCNSLNQPSRQAAERLGFKFEGIFRQHMICKNCNRDTAWFSIIDSEWPTLKAKFQKWLSPDNFDAQGKQILNLRNSDPA